MMIDLRIREPREDAWIMSAYVGLDDPFTRSNGTVLARLYERLTKASRRRSNKTDDGMAIPGVDWGDRIEEAYRQGLYDAYKALQEELSV